MLFKTIAIAADHAGFPTKEYVKNYLEEKGITVVITSYSIHYTKLYDSV